MPVPRTEPNGDQYFKIEDASPLLLTMYARIL
jgi:hypothetical protein